MARSIGGSNNVLSIKDALDRRQKPVETIAALTELLGQAKRGEIIGMVFAVMYSNRTYIVDATDEARGSSTFARGMVAELDDELARICTRNNLK